jgi:4-coumarate--CoA ligase
MVSRSSFPDVEIPNVDLWGLMFDRKEKDFPDSKGRMHLGNSIFNFPVKSLIPLVVYRAVDSSRHYTFSEVKAAAVSFGEGLRALWDWEKNDVLALFAPNDIDIPSVIYGTFFAGGIVTPANPAYSADELAYQLSNSEAKGIVTTKQFLPVALKAAERCKIPSDRVILLGAERDDTHRVKHWSSIRKTSGSTRYRRRKANPDKDLAFLAYSSGTTGLPKGVMLSHRNIIADVLMVEGAVGRWYNPTSDKFLGVLPFFHIYGLTGLVHQILHRGIELVVMPVFNIEVFLKAIQEHKITFIYVAPPVIVRLARDPIVEKYDISTVKMITSGAAPLTKELVDAVWQRLKIKINQAYGLSETSPMTHTQVSMRASYVESRLINLSAVG